MIGTQSLQRPFPVISLGGPVSNAWLLPQTQIGPILIDSGFPLLWPAIRYGLGRHGLAPSDLTALVLTHRHCDHAGNAQRLLSRYGVPVYAHPADAVHLEGRQQPPKLREGREFTRLFAHIENWMSARVEKTLPVGDGDRIAGLEVFAVPGHTAGSIFLYHRDSGTLFTGDTILNAVPPLAQVTNLCLPHPPYCEDYALAIRSITGFFQKGLPVRRLCPGHGPVRRGDILAEVEGLLDELGGVSRRRSCGAI